MKTLATLLGTTKTITLSHIGREHGTIYVKMALLNPSGSIKDDMAFYMLEQVEKKGLIKPGATILEVTTGNTGIAFAMLSAIKGYRFIAVMPEHMSVERIDIMKAFGAHIITTPKHLDVAGAVARYEELKKEYPDAWLPNQFGNPDNVESHRIYAGAEILKSVDKKIDFLVAGVGTGGTLIGCGAAIKERYPDCIAVAVEPAESPILSGGAPGLHGIQGIGEGFITDIVKNNRSMIDRIIQITTDEAIAMTRRLAREEGILAGISSGANILAALRLLKENPGATIVTFAADRGERYLNLGLYGAS